MNAMEYLKDELDSVLKELPGAMLSARALRDLIATALMKEDMDNRRGACDPYDASGSHNGRVPQGNGR